MCIYYYNGMFGAQQDSGQYLSIALDSRTDTLIDDLMTLFKAHARIDFPDDDELCKLYLSAAISRIEQWAMMPIAPAAYSWDASKAVVGTSDGVYLPLRNSVMPGDQFGFELLIAPKKIPMPANWPIVIEVGFSAGADMPSDLKLGIFSLALALYEARSNTEMQDVYASNVMNGSLSRYWVSRV